MKTSIILSAPLIASLIAATGSLSAQSIRERVIECSMRSDPAEARRCAEAIIEGGIPGFMSRNWTRHSGTSPIDRTPILAFVKGSLPAFGLQAQFMMRCMEKSVSAIVTFPQTISTTSLAGVIVRIGDEAPQRQIWNPTTGGNGIGNFEPREFLQKLPAQGTFAIRVTDIAGQPYEYEFSLEGIAPIREEVFAVCNK